MCSMDVPVGSDVINFPAGRRASFINKSITLINRAKEILPQLEEKNVDPASAKSSIGEQVKKLSAPKIQLSIFDAHSETFEQIRKLLEDTDINRVTRVEALLKLQDIKGMIKRVT